MKGKRILIAGGAGSIGSELVRQLAPKNKIYVLDTNESGLFDTIEPLKQKGYWVHGRVGDIRNAKTVNDTFEDFHPQIVYNCAAYKHVPLMEYTPLEAIDTNVIGHYNLIHSAKTHREWLEKFVFISTDKVNSYSIMGATKRLSEIITRNQGKGYVVVRFGNVMGSRGSLTTIWQRQHDNGDALTVTDPRMDRFMMTIPEACHLVTEATEIGEGGEIICLDMGKKVNILSLAESIVKQVGGEVTVSGVRPGETMTEEIMTEEEKRVAIKSGRFLIIK